MKRLKKSYICIAGIIFLGIGLIIASKWQKERRQDQPLDYKQISDNIDKESEIIARKQEMIEEKTISYPENIEYLISATYFGDEWPMNFWNSEFTNLKDDFKQIVLDGFNSIILVIPWREFQPEVDPIVYNNFAFEKLKYIMSEAEKYDLDVVVRIGYTWDYYEDYEESVTERFYKILYDETVRNSWYDYCKTLYNTCANFSNFAGGFITWEDFWCNSYLGDTLKTEEERTEYAQVVGYQAWLEENVPKNDLEECGIRSESLSGIKVPCNDDADMIYWYKFLDDFFIDLLLESQLSFPDLSMEVRTDWDVYIDKDGVNQYIQHYSTYDCGQSSFTTVMYGIPQGCENKGEKLHYTEAMDKTEYILKGILEHNNRKPIYVDQFIFFDNTQGFEMNAQLYENEVDDYLMNIGNILKQYTRGYGIWTYRNYAANLLYNPQFGEKADGWEIMEGEIVSEGPNYSVRIMPNGRISQEIPKVRNHYSGNIYTITFDIQVKEPALIGIKLGNAQAAMKVGQSGKVEMELNTEDPSCFSINTDNEIEIDNIKVYNFIQEGCLYELDGSEDDAIFSMRILNNSCS